MSTKSLKIVRSPRIAFDHLDLNNGVAFGRCPAACWVYDAGIYVPTAFDGTTPSADLGIYEDGDVAGFFGTDIASPRDLTQEDTTGGISSTLLGQLNNSLSQAVGTGAGYLPAYAPEAATFYVVASQDGLKGGDPLDSAQGELVAWVLIGR